MEDRAEVSAKEFADRRARIAQKMQRNSIALVPAGRVKSRNGDAAYLFRQDSHFYYLTGFCEPDALLALVKTDKMEVNFILFCEPRDPSQEIWTGKMSGLEGAVHQFGADRAYPFSDLDSVMPALLENKQHIYYSLGKDAVWEERVFRWINQVRSKARSGIGSPSIWVDVSALIEEARLVKSPAEIGLMRMAASISAEAHKNLMQICRPNMMEYELEALLLQNCYSKGCRAMAYPSIVAGGANACTLHYGENNKRLKSGDLVLVDAGGEFQYYASDITRTFPVNGQFTEAQKLIYACVLKAQTEAIAAVRPGVRWDALQKVILQALVRGLVELGLLEGSVDDLIAQQAYKSFYMHGSGHWLGLDVHDAGAYKVQGEYRALESGMVLTIEPGIYIAPESIGVDAKWLGIGVRIEDDILVTDTGYEVLSHAVPKTIEAIEQLMAAHTI